VTTGAADADDQGLVDAGEPGRVAARHYGDLLTRARLRLPAAGADDVAHDAVLRFLREARAGRRYAVPPRVVLHQMLGWALLDHFGRRRHDGPAEGWDAVDPGAEAELGRVDDAIALRDLFDGLPPRDGRVMTMHVLDEMTPAEIAGSLGISRNAVDQALFRARRALRETWSGG
jgi:RNA polymerase sigma factor (sigma-70 family)